MMVASMAGYQVKVSAATPDGFTDLTEDKWHPLGETVDTTIGTDNQPASVWNVYTGAWSNVVASVKDGKDDQDTVSKVTKMPAGADGTQADGSQYMVATTLDKDTLKGNVRKVRINIAQSLGWGAQVTEIAVFSENPQELVAVESADNPAKVTVSSEPSKDFTGNIKFNITAGENQDGYKYAVFVDDSETASFADCVAGKDYTITGVSSEKHTVKVISIYNGGYSTGLQMQKLLTSYGCLVEVQPVR